MEPVLTMMPPVLDMSEPVSWNSMGIYTLASVCRGWKKKQG